ncbi:MAG: trypsin-like peptidase domain-containing protein [Elusimicrobia bacterium]|nr:trypsin-like peptidase domain-containing protein [Elusimicrobiota bacterium]
MLRLSFAAVVSALTAASPVLAAPQGGELIPAVAGFHAPRPYGPARSVGELSNGCSSVYVSRSGYLLTNGHCVYRELSQAKVSSRFEIYLFEHEPGRAAVYRSPMPRMSVDGHAVSLVAAGSGFTMVREYNVDLSRFPDDPAEYARWERLIADWALLKVERDTPAPCLRSEARRIVEGEKLTSIGYPAPARRAGAPSSIPHALNETRGVATLDIDKDEWIAAQRPETRDVMRRLLRRAVAEGDSIQADLDGYRGMSGSPILDAPETLVGVLRGGGSDHEAFRAFSANGVPIGLIRRELAAAGIDPAEIFHCPDLPATHEHP